MEERQIAFSPPDITDLEITEVIQTLKSGWITTGPRTKLFEQKIAEYCGCFEFCHCMPGSSFKILRYRRRG